MSKRIKLVFFIVLAILITICSYFLNKTDKFSVPDGSPPWRVVVYSSSLYPATVQAVHAINYDQDWTKVLMGMSDGIRTTKVKEIEKIFPKYNGFGIPLHHLFGSYYQQSDHGYILPEEINLYWTSEVNSKFFVTTLYVNDIIVSNMNRILNYNNNDDNEGCFPTDFNLALFPDGTTKVWLSCGGRYRSVNAKVSTKEVTTDYNGNNYKDWIKSGRIKKIENRANYFGVKLFPINKKEIDKVYSDRKID